jgi:hypothetical protein
VKWFSTFWLSTSVVAIIVIVLPRANHYDYDHTHTTKQKNKVTNLLLKKNFYGIHDRQHCKNSSVSRHWKRNENFKIAIII